MLHGEEEESVEESLDEMEALLTTLGVSTAGRVVQKRHKLVSKSFLGSGKVDEIKALAEDVGADLLVVDGDLSAVQVRNIETMTCLPVYDRTGVILDIFAEHARTNQAKTQVEIAQLEYLLPRLTGAWTHFQRQTGGGVRARGMGEKQIEVDRRRARERVAKLREQLRQFEQDRRVQSKSRKQELKVALVGYTNSGKTTLMSALTKSQEVAKDELFATLDTNVKIIDPRTRPKILLSDTVGFIRNLPHSLVESFKSTLANVLEADLLLLIVDAHANNYRGHIETTQRVLQDIGAGDIPSVFVFNKIDKVDDPFLSRILKQAYPGSICLSARNEADADRLREHIYDFFKNDMERATLRVAHSNQEVISTIYSSCLILESDYADQEEVVFQVQASKRTIAKLSPYRSHSI